MEWLPVISLAGGLSAFGLAIAALLFKPRNAAQWLLAAGLVLFAGECLCQRMSFLAISQESMIRWQAESRCLAAFVPAVWLAFSLAFARGEPRRHLRRWLPAILVLGIVLPGVAFLSFPQLASNAKATLPAGNWFFPSTWPVKVLDAGLLAAAVLILTNLEWTFRAAVGTSRWRVKYAVIGLALLFGTRIYTRSQALLYGGVDFQMSLMNSAALFLATLLIAFSFYRSKLAAVDVYPSATALYKSLTVLIAGFYLVVVGIVAKIVDVVGGEEAFPLLTFLLLLAAVGLSILWLSDRVRQGVKQFVSLHFRRPMYDYRRVWSAFTERTAAQLDRVELCRAVARLISETFEVLSVTVWLLDAARGKLQLAASTSLTSDQAVEPSDATALLQTMSALKAETVQPVLLDQSDEAWCRLLREANPTFFPAGGKRVCVPLNAGGEAIGFLVLGDRVAGTPFTPEDLDLLKCLGEQLGAALRTLNLSEQIAQAREMQAFQAMSAFLVHDLKNTASTLTLMLRNMAVHYDKPAFREDALRGLSNSAQHINDLISRLTTLRQKLEIRKSPGDLKDIAQRAVSALGDAAGVRLEQAHQPLPKLALDGPQIESVVTNLLFNARDALNGEGTIRIQTERHDRWAVLTVSDTGCGMTPEFVANHLFKPFQTTKKKGLGIGMFQARTIVEAHGGRIEVQSASGKGTAFRVWLPLPAEENPKA